MCKITRKCKKMLNTKKIQPVSLGNHFKTFETQCKKPTRLGGQLSQTLF